MKTFAVFLLFFSGFIIYQGVCQPIVGNDAVTYALYGRVIFNDLSFDNYPTQTEFLMPEGKMPHLLHPPGLPILYSWFYILAGSSDPDYCIRTVSVIYGFYLVFCVLFILHKNKYRYAGLFSFMIFAITPLFYYQTIGNNIDSIRMTLIFMSTFFLYKLIQYETIFTFLATLVTLVLGIFFHYGTVIIIPIFIIVYLLFSSKIQKRVLSLILFTVIFIGFQYTLTRTSFGGEWVSLLSLKKTIPTETGENYRRALAFGNEWLDELNNMKISREQQFFKEHLQIYSRPPIFGLTFYIGTCGIVMCAAAQHKKLFEKMLLVVLFLFAVPVLYKHYLNYRYIATITPIVVYFAAVFLDSAFIYVTDILSFSRLKIAERIRYVTLNLALVVAISVCAMLLFFSMKDIHVNMMKLTELSPKERFTTAFIWFASWKRSAHPIYFRTMDIDKSLPRGAKMMIIDNQFPPEFHYYFRDRMLCYYSSGINVNFMRRKKTDKETMDYLEELKVACIITNPISATGKYYYASKLPGIISNPEYSKELFKSEELNIYYVDTGFEYH